MSMHLSREEIMNKLEVVRSQFEYWYATQSMDQEARWHSADSLTFDKDEYPYGRYTVMSMKQKAWIIFQAGYFNGTNEPVLVPNIAS